MHRKRRHRIAEHPAHIVCTVRHDRSRQSTEVAVVATGRQHRDGFLIQDGLPGDRCYVDDRRVGSDRHRLLNGSQTHFCINGHRSGAAEDDALAPEGVEALERRGHDVNAGPQVDNLVSPVAIGDGRANLFDQHRTGRLDGHAR